MLLEISIKNFAIIEAISLNFEKGMTVLTGETGAGKSIIIDAMNMICLLYTSPSPRDSTSSRMPSSA